MMEEKLHIKENNGIPVLVQWPASQQLGILVEQNDVQGVVFFPNGSIISGGGYTYSTYVADQTVNPFT